MKWWIREVESAVSTQNLIFSMGRMGAPSGTVVIAGEQTGGRGRLGRRWESPKGGLYASALLRDLSSPSETPSLTLAVGLAVAESLEEIIRESMASHEMTGPASDPEGDPVALLPRIEWPNDILIRGRKVAGILSEESGGLVAVGIGVNISRIPDGTPFAIALGDLIDEPPSPAFLLDKILDNLSDLLEEWIEKGLGPMIPRILDRLAGKGENILFDQGTGAFEALLLGLDPSGRLILDRGKGEEVFESGRIIPGG